MSRKRTTGFVSLQRNVLSTGRQGRAGPLNEDHILTVGWPLQFGELKSESESVSDVNSTFKGWEDDFQSESEIINQCDTGKDSKQAIAENSNISSVLLCQDEGHRKKSQADGIESYHSFL